MPPGAVLSALPILLGFLHCGLLGQPEAVHQGLGNDGGVAHVLLQLVYQRNDTSLYALLAAFLPAFLADIVSLNFPNSFLAKQSSHDIMHLLLACVQKRNEHSTFQANPDGFAGSYICSPMQSNFSFAQKKKAPCQRQGANLREAKQLTE